MSKVKIDTPATVVEMLGRVSVDTMDHKIAVFVKANGDIWSIFADTVLGMSYIKTPKYGSKLVGCFCNKDNHDEILTKVHFKKRELEKRGRGEG